MAKDVNTTLSHVYGIASLIPAIIGLLYLIKTDAPWQNYALLLSGWVVAIAYGTMLWRSFNQARTDGETVGTLTERAKALEKELEDFEKKLEACVKAHTAELDRRQSTMDYLAGQLLSQRALPRSATAKQAKPRKTTEGEAK